MLLWVLMVLLHVLLFGGWPGPGPSAGVSGMVYLLPPGSEYDSGLLDFDDEKYSETWAELPQSLLEQPARPLEWNDLTLEGDAIITHRHRRHRHKVTNGQVKENSSQWTSSDVDQVSSLERGNQPHSQRRWRRSVSYPHEEEISNLVRTLQKSSLPSSRSTFKPIYSETLFEKDTVEEYLDFIKDLASKFLAPNVKSKEGTVSMRVVEPYYRDGQHQIQNDSLHGGLDVKRFRHSSLSSLDTLHSYSSESSSKSNTSKSMLAPSNMDWGNDSISSSTTFQNLISVQDRQNSHILALKNERAFNKGFYLALNATGTDTQDFVTLSRTKRSAHDSSSRDSPKSRFRDSLRDRYRYSLSSRSRDSLSSRSRDSLSSRSRDSLSSRSRDSPRGRYRDSLSSRSRDSLSSRSRDSPRGRYRDSLRSRSRDSPRGRPRDSSRSRSRDNGTNRSRDSSRSRSRDSGTSRSRDSSRSRSHDNGTSRSRDSSRSRSHDSGTNRPRDSSRSRSRDNGTNRPRDSSRSRSRDSGTSRSRDRRRSRYIRLGRFRNLRASIIRRRTRPMPMPQAIVHRRRPVRVDAKVGVMAVLDFSIYQQYLKDNYNNRQAAFAKIKRYYGMLFAMVDQRFGTINHPYLSISVRLSGILVAESREEARWIEQVVDWSTVSTHGTATTNTLKALHHFSAWISKQKGLPKFDHAMAFTRYRLGTKGGGFLAGLANMAAVCDTDTGNAASIVGDRGDFSSAKVAAHELAHSFGAYHDGTYTAKACPYENYIMGSMISDKLDVLKNTYYFSKCSIRDMYIHLRKSRSACIRDEPVVYYKYDLARHPPGQLYSADQQCKLIFGKNSHFCNFDSGKDGIMCSLLWCAVPEHNTTCTTNSFITALPGTPCGTNKVCHLGQCIPDPKKNIDLSRGASRPTRLPTLRGRIKSLPGLTQRSSRTSFRNRSRNRRRNGRRRRIGRRRRHRSRLERQRPGNTTPRPKSDPYRPRQSGPRPDSGRPQEPRSRPDPYRPQEPRSRSDPSRPPGSRPDPDRPPGSRPDLTRREQPGSRSDPYMPHNPRSKPDPYRPQNPGSRPDPYRPMEPRSRSGPYRPPGSRPDLYGPQNPRSRPDPYRPQEPRSRSDPYRPHQPGSRLDPFRPQEPSSRLDSYGPNQPGSRPDPNRSQLSGSRSDPYGPQQPRSRLDRHRSPGSRPDPYRPQQPRSRYDPYRPNQPRSRSDLHRPQQPRSRNDLYRPQQPRSRSDLHRPQQPRSRPDPYRPESPRSKPDYYRPTRPQCTADKNTKYCQGLVRVNQAVCRRQDIREYCCVTCHYQRRRRRRKRR